MSSIVFTLLNSLLMSRKGDPSFIAVELRGILCVRLPILSSQLYWQLWREASSLRKNNLCWLRLTWTVSSP